MPKKKLTPKQQCFIKEYLVDLNATQAAIRAKYSKKTADRIGHENLKKLEVEIQAEINKRNNRIEVSQDRVLREVARLALFDPRKFYDEKGNLIPIHKLDDDSAAVIAGMEITELGDGEKALGLLKKIKLARKDKSLEMLMKHLGLFEIDNTQRSDITFKVVYDDNKNKNVDEQK